MRGKTNLTRIVVEDKVQEWWDDATNTYHDYRFGLDDSRPYNAEELLEKEQRLLKKSIKAVEETLVSDTVADLTKLRNEIDTLAIVLGDKTVTGSLRNWRAQDNSTLVTAASLKALIGIMIEMAQAERVTLRQVLRLAKKMTGDYTSADVGADVE